MRSTPLIRQRFRCVWIIVIGGSLAWSIPSAAARGGDDSDAASAEFQRLDRDKNGVVSLEEFLKDVPERERVARRSTFYERDFDADGWLSLKEASNEDRSKVSPLLQMFRKFDADGNGMLNRREYVEPAKPAFEEAATQEFPLFDRDDDGQLTYEEFLISPRVKLEIPVRFRILDGDRNQRLSISEFLKPHARASRIVQRRIFYSWDADNDQQLSLEEFEKRGEGVVPSLRNRYLARDADGDGKMSREEYYSPSLGTKWEQAAKTEAVEFDADGDGFLSLLEFTATPQDPLAAKEVFELADENADGFLDYSEFLKLQPPSRKAAQHRSFYSWDADNDQRLSLEEYGRKGQDVVPSLKNKYLACDTNRDGKVSREEYVAPHLNTRWEQAAKDEALRFDVDRDGSLTLLEFAMTPHGPQASEELFPVMDANGDGVLNRFEFLKIRPKDVWPAMGAAFLHADANGDDQLSTTEFLNVGKDTPTRLDPFVQHLDELLKSIESICSAADRDGDGRLTAREWPQDKLPQATVALGTIPFRDWDRNGDGSVDEKERRLLAEIAFSIRRTDGQLLRKPKCHVVNWNYFRMLDKNHDGSLSKEEFVSGYYMGAKNIELFSEWNKDDDNRLTFAEVSASPHFNADVFWDFCLLDTDLDGRIVPQEVSANCQPWQKKMAPRLIPAFDTDKDGALNLNEYVMTPFTILSTDWYALRHDTDFDGKLSWGEFYTDRSPASAGIGREFFNRFDLNGDGFLSLSEFDFTVDVENAPPEVAFAFLDKDGNGRLQMSDIVDSTRPPANDPSALLRWEELNIRIEDAFRAADSDGDGALTAQEFGKQQATVTAAILGKRVRAPAARAASTGGPASASARGEDLWNWRMIGLGVCNAIVLVGLGWMLLKRSAKS